MRAALLGFLILFVSGGVLIFLGIRGESASRAVLEQRVRPLESVNSQVRSSFAGAQALLRAYLLTGDSGYLGRYEVSRRAAVTGLARAAALSQGQWHADVGVQQAQSAVWFGFAAQMHRPPGHRLTQVMNASTASARAFYRANGRLGARLAGYARKVARARLRSFYLPVAAGGGLIGATFLLGLAVTVGTSFRLTRPLAGITSTLRRLTSGEHTARAAVNGAAEAQEVARSVNALADEAERLRAQETENRRLLELARDAGYHIREHLRAQDVINEARRAMEANIDAEVVYLHLLEDQGLSQPVGHEGRSLMPEEFIRDYTAEVLAPLREAFKRQSSVVIQDVQGTEGEQIPAKIRARLRELGTVSRLITPFGVGPDMLGFIVALRMRTGRPWTAPEIAAVESIATDLGRGLHHARMYEAENQLVDRLKAVDQAKSDFLAMVSHELRTPLTNIAGNAETLREAKPGPLTAAQRRMLDSVERNTARLRLLVEDVLTLSRIEAGSFTTAMVPVSLADAVPAAVSALRPAAARRGVSLAFARAGPMGGLVVAGDPVQLDRMLRNLLSNAVKFTPQGGEVRLSAAAEGATAVVKVTDTGWGIPPRDREELFTRFFRASNAVERSVPGTGLGLAIVRTIIDNHGGDIVVDSEEGKGTTVTVRIPLLVGAGAGAAEDARLRSRP